MSDEPVPGVQQDEEYYLVPPDEPFRDGFTWHTFWAALFVGVIMLPGSIYLNLVDSTGVAWFDDVELVAEDSQ